MRPATAGSSAGTNCGGSAMSAAEALVFLTLATLLAMIVTMFDDNNGGAA